QIVHRHFLTGQATPFFAPCSQGHQDRPEIRTFFSQMIFEAWRTFVVALPLDYSISLKLLEACRHHLRSRAGHCLDLVEPVTPGKQLAQDEYRPDVTENALRPGNRA